MKTILLSFVLLLPSILMSQTVGTINKGDESFFRRDTAYLKGYIDGYDSKSCSKNSLINLANNLTSEDSPVVVNIHPDGNFDCKLLLNHPVESSFFLNDLLIPFYIEPGQTLSIYINWKEISKDKRAYYSNSPIKGIEYEGPSAVISQMYRNFSELENHPNNLLANAVQELTPDQFMQAMEAVSAKWDQIADSLIQIHGTSEKAIHLLKNKIALEKGRYYFFYLLSRPLYAQRDSTNQILKIKEKDTHYCFLKDFPLNDETMMADDRCGEFINRFEYMPPLQKARYMNLETVQPTDSKKITAKDIDRMILSNNKRYLTQGDSVVYQLSGQSHSFFWQASLVRRLKNDLKNFQTRSAAEDYIHTLCNQLTYPILIEEARRIFEVARPKQLINSYQLPESKAANIFRDIIKAHAGKVLFIDFWATSCGGCRRGIQETAALRQKYKNHPEFQFIYISDDGSSKATYDAYVAKNLQGEACYRISSTDYNYLRELFRFNGIPHYELIEKDGSVSMTSPTSWELKNYLEKRFGKSIQKENTIQ